MTRPGLTPYITPAMLLSTNFGISWGTFPKQGTGASDQVAAQLDVCATVTSEMDTIANQILRATIDVETEFGPDQTITMLRNGWARYRLSSWPILTILGAQVSPSGAIPPAYRPIPLDALAIQHPALPETGTTVPAGGGPAPTSIYIGPGYVSWANGRNGYLVQASTVAGFPVAGIDVAVAAAATSIHVDDITGWVGARGLIYDPPLRESVLVTAAAPDTANALSGPGTLTLSAGLQFGHAPKIAVDAEADQRVLMTTMPRSLIQAGFYLATHYGLIRGATASTMQTARGSVTTSGMKGAMDWYSQAETAISRYARTF